MTPPALVTGTPDKSPNRAAIDDALPLMEMQFGVVDRAVAKTGHLAGPGFTLADIYLMPILYHMGKFPDSTALLARHAHLSAYRDRHLARKSIAETIPPNPPGRR